MTTNTEQLKHTPGPWWTTDSGVRERGGYICHTNQPTHFQGQDERYDRELAERRANKNLIAAAPELLAALEYAHACLTNQLSTKTKHEYAIDLARVAIAKATGEHHDQ